MSKAVITAGLPIKYVLCLSNEANAVSWLTMLKIWGFEEVQGKRYHVRHVVVRKGDDWKQARLVYDFRSR